MNEVNIDCLAGPTHHFGGLSFGNIASEVHKGVLSHPKKAALQGLEKMKLVSDLGVAQLVLPPHPRPHFKMLQKLGFTGSKEKIIHDAYREKPEILLQLSSSSAMWAANAAVITPSADSPDKKVHITPANLATHFHRSIEAEVTHALLKRIFSDEKRFQHHDPLPSTPQFFDEGAANHTRLYSNSYVHLFVHGKSERYTKYPSNYPRRQTKEAHETISRLHGLDPKHVVMAEQNPDAIDRGVFHNDVISTGFKNIFLYHEDAFVDTDKVISKLKECTDLQPIKISRTKLSIDDAVKSYLFNSQIIQNKEGDIVLLCPAECEEMASAKESLQYITSLSPIKKVIFVPLDESMSNGGGPACLRLRALLSDEELQAVHPDVVFDNKLYGKLKEWICKYYPDEFRLQMLLDPEFIRSLELGYQKILEILNLSFFPFL